MSPLPSPLLPLFPFLLPSPFVFPSQPCAPPPSALPISVPVHVTVFAPSPSPSLFPFAPSRHASDLVSPSRYNARARAPGVGNGLLAACKRQRLSAEMMSRADREKAPIVKHNKIAAEDVLLPFPRLDAENRGSIYLNCALILNLLLADVLTTALSEWVHAAGSWYNSTLMSCEGKVAVEFIGWT